MYLIFNAVNKNHFSYNEDQLFYTSVCHMIIIEVKIK